MGGHVGFRVKVECYAACAVATEHAGFVLVGEEPGIVGLLLGERIFLLEALEEVEEEEAGDDAEEEETGDDGKDDVVFRPVGSMR